MRENIREDFLFFDFSFLGLSEIHKCSSRRNPKQHEVAKFIQWKILHNFVVEKSDNT